MNNRRIRWFSLLLAGVLMAPWATAQSNDQAEVLLQAALHQELVDGNLEEAIRLYKDVLANHGGNHAVEARALVQIGRCYEKLGRPEARKVYEQVLRDYPDQQDMVAEARARLSALVLGPSSRSGSGLVIRRVSASAGVDGLSGVSADGRYMSHVDWETGNLALLDLTTGQTRRLTKKGSWFDSDEYAESSRFSPDDKQIAYVWMTKDGSYEIRLIGFDGGEPRVLYHNEEVAYIPALEWVPDGQAIVAILRRKDGANQIAVVSMADSSARVLKTLDWRYPLEISVSPDGRYVAYDFPTKEDAPERDVFLLAMDGSHEVPLVQHPANDFVLGWAPDGKRLLFGSDRTTGSPSVWIITVVGGRSQGSPELLRPDMGRSWPMRLTTGGSYYYGVPIGMDDVYVATIDATMSKLVTSPVQVAQSYVGANRWPEWSPDGKQIAYVSQGRPGIPEGGSLILTIQSLETGKQRQLVPRLTYFNRLRWSPDGRSILAHGRDDRNRGGLYRIDVRSGAVTPILRTSSGLPRQAAWSPDQKAVLYSNPGTGGGIIRRELDTGLETVIQPPGVYDFALSPDGRWLVASSDDAQTKTSVLKLLPVGGGESRELARAEGSGAFAGGCAWVPDVRHVLCSKRSPVTGTSELWRLSIEDGSAQRLLVMMNNMREVRVHPDGRHIAFIAGKFNAEIWVMENFLPPLPTRATSAVRP